MLSVARLAPRIPSHLAAMAAGRVMGKLARILAEHVARKGACRKQSAARNGKPGLVETQWQRWRLVCYRSRAIDPKHFVGQVAKHVQPAGVDSPCRHACGCGFQQVRCHARSKRCLLQKQAQTVGDVFRSSTLATARFVLCSRGVGFICMSGLSLVRRSSAFLRVQLRAA